MVFLDRFTAQALNFSGVKVVFSDILNLPRNISR